MSYDIKWVQSALKQLGFYNDKVDGVAGPNTHAAIIAFKRSVGLKPRAYVGPITKLKLKTAVKGMTRPGRAKNGRELPWINEINDHGALSAWLRSDGRTVGDPASIPWCGDAVETAMILGLPNEPVVPSTKDNPYWARNWEGFGHRCGLVYGAVASFSRDGGGGHVGFLVGISADGNLLRIRGGNQSNMLNDTWIAADRLLATRWPIKYPFSGQRPAPVMNSTGGIISQNEA